MIALALRSTVLIIILLPQVSHASPPERQFLLKLFEGAESSSNFGLPPPDKNDFWFELGDLPCREADLALDPSTPHALPNEQISQYRSHPVGHETWESLCHKPSDSQWDFDGVEHALFYSQSHDVSNRVSGSGFSSRPLNNKQIPIEPSYVWPFEILANIQGPEVMATLNEATPQLHSPKIQDKRITDMINSSEEILDPQIGNHPSLIAPFDNQANIRELELDESSENSNHIPQSSKNNGKRKIDEVYSNKMFRKKHGVMIEQVRLFLH
ncbi:hypothetical protein O181_007833 [Austropuccinia psidii MF-1]|uniref:Uncharacterized protein n=1 Tax=Austropuccinia psidii MF-1 TaxID=1389203 RepID=A0A9Q3BN93_9BASI|nr:hypothetical protein [Austropuccinia psidii MF-1]